MTTGSAPISCGRRPHLAVSRPSGFGRVYAKTALPLGILEPSSASVTWPVDPNSCSITMIRTFLSFSLETEIEGVWPWQRGQGRRQV